MRGHIVRRLLIIIPVLVLVSMIAFSLAFLLPGDPARAILGEGLAGDTAAYEALRAELGLDRPVPIQYLSWAGRALRGDLGLSTRNHQPVAEAILARLAPTVQLTIMSLMWALLIGIPIGILSAIRPNSLMDVVGTIFAIGGVAVTLPPEIGPVVK